jgi:hypothetical protein
MDLKSGLVFIIEDGRGNLNNVIYDAVSLTVFCGSCSIKSCEHIRFMQEVFTVNQALETADFLKDMTGRRFSPEDIGTMQRVFDRATNRRQVEPVSFDFEKFEKGIVKSGNRKKTPKQPPSPFSLIEMD